MAVNFYIKNPNAVRSSILLQVTFKGQLYRRSTGESIPPQKWNPKTMRCVTTGFPAGPAINKVLNLLESRAVELCNHFVECRRIPDPIEFFDEFDKLINNNVTVGHTFFVDYIEQFVAQKRDNWAQDTYKKYLTTINKLRQFETSNRKRLGFENINLRFYYDFERWFMKQNYSTNYFSSIIKNIKVAFRYARDVDKLHNFTEVDSRHFKVSFETADTIYLTEQELLKIYNLEISADKIIEAGMIIDQRDNNIEKKVQAMDIARKKFLIGAFTALRVSDFNRLSDINVKDGLIQIRTQKTGIAVTIPMHWIIKEILDSGFDLREKISDQKINEHIKEVARLAGINDIVEITRNIGGKRLPFTQEKWELITNHTARRSGATNMVKFGLPPLSIMKITGHKSWVNFMKYIKLSNEENADILAKSGFFDKPK